MRKTKYFAAVLAALMVILALAAPALAQTPRAPARSAAADPTAPAPSYADRFGECDPHLMFHDEATKESLMSRMQDAGVSWVRVGFAWSDIEPVEGSFTFGLADQAVASARKHGVRILGVLGFTPFWASGQWMWNYPPTPEHIPQWRNYVRTVCSRYKAGVYAWEIWNEENIPAFWMPQPNASDYVNLVRNTTPEIRAADPGAMVLMGGVAGLDPAWQHSCLDLGIADYVDALAYHPYTWTLQYGSYTPQEQHTAALVAWERALISEHTARPLEIWLTEFGWTTCQSEPGAIPQGVDEQTQADYLLRSFINYADTDADRVIPYNLWDEGEDPADPEYNYGVLSNDLTPKKAYYYYSTFQHVIGRAQSRAPDAVTFTCSRPDTLQAHSFLLDDGRLAVAAWKSDDQADSLNLSLSSASYELPNRVDLTTGQETAVSGASYDGQGRARVTGLEVGKSPVILTFQGVNREWFLAEGTTAWGFVTYISMMNPNPVPVTADVTYMTLSGPTAGPSVNLPAESQATIWPKETLGARDFSTKVTCRQHLPIAVDRTMAWTGQGAGSLEAHSCVGVTAPARTWYLPEGSSAWGFECWLLVQNPGSAKANVTITYMPEGSGPMTVSSQVPPASRRTYSMSGDIGSRDASIKVASDVPVVCERAMYRNARRSGHDSVGSAVAARDFYLAEGTTAYDFTTYVIIQNPNASPVTVTLTYMTGDGPVTQPGFVMPASSRKTVRVNDVLPGRDLSIRAHANLPVIAERSMYWDAGAGEACHDSIGAAAPHRAFYMPDGQTSGGRETWTCVQNPNPAAVTVRVTYLTTSGSGNASFTELMPADTRRTLRMADRLPSTRAAVAVTCETGRLKIVVERSMYWDSRGAGTDTVGAFSD